VVFDDATLANTPGNDGVIKAKSNNASDNSQVLTITGRNAAGIIVTDTLTLAGTSARSGVGLVAFERILRLSLNVAPSGIIQVTNCAATPAPITNIPAGVKNVYRPFYDVAADVTGGDNRVFYEKIFVKNTNGSLALTNCTISEIADPSNNLTFALENNKGGTQTVTSREIAPTGCSSFVSTSVAPENNYINSGETQAVWLKLSLNAGTAASKTTYTLRVAGTST